MPVVFVPFGPWRAEDRGVTNPSATTSIPPQGFTKMSYVRGLYPHREGYSQIYLEDKDDSYLTTNYPPNGAHCHRHINSPKSGVVSTYYVDKTYDFFGTPADLVEVSTDGKFNVTKTVAGQYITDATAASLEPLPWCFADWGGTVLATNFSSPLQRQTARNARFTDAITSAFKPKAAFVTTLGQHVVLGNIYVPAGAAGGTGLTTGPGVAGSHPQLVCWSKTDSEQSFSDPATDPSWNSDFQDLPDLGGPIKGFARISDDAIVWFKSNGCHLMARTGDINIYNFQILHEGQLAGVYSHQSIVVDGRDIYYMSGSGIPCVMRNLGHPEPLTATAPIYYFWASGQNLSGSGLDQYAQVSTLALVAQFASAFDPTNRRIIWRMIVGQPNQSGTCYFLIYHLDTGGFTIADTTPPLTALFTSNYDVTGDTPVVRAWSHTNPVRRVSFIPYKPVIPGTWPVLNWSLETGRVNLQPVEPSDFGVGSGTTTITRVRPVFVQRTYGLTPTITINGYNDFSESSLLNRVVLTPGGGTGVDSHSWYTIPGGGFSAEMFSFIVTDGGSGTDYALKILGLEVDVAPAGSGSGR